MRRTAILLGVIGLCAGLWWYQSRVAAPSPSRSVPAPEPRVGGSDVDDVARPMTASEPWHEADAPLPRETVGTVAGRVLDPNGQVVAGAQVTLHRIRSPWPERRLEQIETTYTGEDGEFQFAALRADDLLVEVVSRNLGRARAVAPPRVARLGIRLQPGFEVTGYVLNALGQAVPGAVVTMEPGPWDTWPAVAVRTDANGAFRFENVSPSGAGVVRLSARDDYFMPATLPAVAIGSSDQVNLKFVRLGTAIAGRVVQSGGERRPVADAEVRVFPSTAWNGGLYVPFTTRTDDRGRFRLSGLGSGNVRIEVRHPHFSTDSRVVSIGQGSSTLAFELVPRSEVGGRQVVDAVRGVGLVLTTAAGEIGRTSAGADGRFAFPDRYSVGSATLEIVDGALSFVRSSGGSMMVNIEDAAQTMLELAVGPSSVLRGRVVDAADRPLAGVQVSTSRNRFAPRSPDRYVTVTDERGVFELRGLPVGTADLLFEHEEFATFLTDEPTGNPGETREAATVTLVRPGIISGRVTRGGKPLPGASVFAGREKNNVAVAVTGTDGSYELHHLAPGRYRIMARYSTLPIQVADGLAEVRSEVTASSVDLDFPAGRQIHGHVVGPDGLPIQDAFVQVTGQTGAFSSTDASGSFKLDLPEGAAELQVSSPDFQTQIRERIGADQDWVTARLPLVPRGTLVAKVLGLPGPRPVGSGVWRLRALDGEPDWSDNERRQRNVASRWVSMSSGQIIIERFPAGRSEFVLHCPGYGAFVAEIDVRRGDTLDLGSILLEPGAMIRGVVQAEGEQPVAGATVHLGEESDLLEFNAQARFLTDPEGRFEIGGVTPNSRRLVVMAEGYTTAIVDLRLPDDLVRAEPLSVVLRPCSFIDVRLVRADGKPPDLALVAVAKDGMLLRVESTDQHGHLRLPALGPGQYSVSVFGEAPSESRVVSVGEHPEVLTVRLPVGNQ